MPASIRQAARWSSWVASRSAGSCPWLRAAGGRWSASGNRLTGETPGPEGTGTAHQRSGRDEVTRQGRVFPPL